MASVLNVQEDNFQGEVLDADKPVLVDFWAPWCGYCQRLGPVLDELATEMGDKVKIVKINVDQNRPLAQKYDVKSMPTMLVFKKGEAVERLMGYMPKDNLSAKLEPLL